MSKDKLLIAKPGIPVGSIRPRDKVFDSDYNYIKIYKTFTGVISAATITIPHNLGYVPLVFGWVKTGGYWLMMVYNNSTSITVVDADATNAYVRQEVLGAGTDKYFIVVCFNEAG